MKKHRHKENPEEPVIIIYEEWNEENDIKLLT